MRDKIILTALIITILTLTLFKNIHAESMPAPENLADYVNPFIGVGEDGRTFPAVSLPFGFTQWTPQSPKETGRAEIPYWGENTITGFRGSHAPQGSWMLDYGCLTIQPQAGSLKLTPAQREVRMENVEAHPDYWSCILIDQFGIKVEITATMHCAIFRLTYLGSGAAYVLVDAHAGGQTFVIHENSEILVHNVQHGYGSSIEGFHVVRFEKPFLQSSAASGELAHADYAVQSGDVILLKVGTSFISYEQARMNLALEIPGWDFENVRRTAREIWNKELGRIEVESENQEDLVKFYTALYHCLLEPSQLSEYGKYYSAFDNKIHECAWGEYYNDFSLWDTFRAEHSLLILLKPREAEDMCQSLTRMGVEGGWIPKWPNPGYSGIMIATHADSVIAETYLKGLVRFDAETAYMLCYKHATRPGPSFFEAREGVEYYTELGYVPANVMGEATSITIESSYDDYALAMFALALGRENEHRYFLERSSYWRNVYDPNAPGEPGNPYRGYVRGRNLDGSWTNPTDFSPTQWYSYITEGTPFQYTWHVMHDVKGLIDAMGGRDIFNAKLDWFFDHSVWRKGNDWSSYYWHGNEPCQHVAYLYNWSGKPWRTQELVRKIMETRYWTITGKIGGLCGNEDCGQTSAWFVFSAMGFYPVCPVGLHYEIGSPLFKKIIVHLPDYHYGGRDFTIIAHNNSKENVYIQSAKLNGKPLNRPWLWHWEIAAGGTLELWMGPQPNYEWGVNPDDMPPSGEYIPWTPLECKSLEAPEKVEIGKNFQATIRVRNPLPATVVGYIVVKIDNENMLKPVIVRGEENLVVFDCLFYRAGEHVISVENHYVIVRAEPSPTILRFPPWRNITKGLVEENSSLKIEPIPSQIVRDLSGNGNNGVLGISSNAEHEDPLIVKDGTNWVFEFNGVNDIITVPSSSSLNLGSEFTISAWIYYVHTPGIHRIISKWGANYSQKSYQLWIAGSGWGGPKDEVILETRDGGVVNTGYVMPSEEWHLLTWVHSRSDGFDRLFVDAQLVFERSVIADPSPSDQSLGLAGQTGIEQSRRFNFRGRMDDIRIYRRALNSQEIQTLFLGGLVEDQALVARWDADDPACFAGGSESWNSGWFEFGFPVKLISVEYGVVRSIDENVYLTLLLDNQYAVGVFGPISLEGDRKIWVENIITEKLSIILELQTSNSIHSPKVRNFSLAMEPAEAARFIFENLNVEPHEVLPGEPVTIFVDIKNVGDLAGTCRIELLIDNDVIDNIDITLQPGEARRVYFTKSLTTPGKHTVTIGGLSVEFNVVSLETKFIILGLNVSKERVKKGEKLEVIVVVKNSGNTSGTYEVILKVDGVQVENMLVSLGPSENIEISFRIRIYKAGKHVVSVDNLAEEINVYEEKDLTSIVVGVAAALLAIALGLKFFFR
ncbi:MAG: GH92 family glycosyl hydrolase [Candidatus Hadarchaeales archaeon]